MRRSSAAGLSFLVAGCMVACSGAALAKVSLRVMTHTYEPFNKWVSQKIGEYKKVNPNIEISYTNVPHDDFDQKIFVSLASGSAPDILNVYYPTLTDLTGMNLLDQPPASIAQQIQAEFIPPAWKGMVMKGKLWGYPTEAIMLLAVANEEFFRNAGVVPPTSYDDLLEFQRKLTVKDANGKVQRIGIMLSNASALWTMLHWSAEMRAYGGEILSSDLTKATFNTPAVARALEYYKELAPTAGPTGGFEKAKVGLAITGAYSRSSWRLTNKNIQVKSLPALTGSDGQKIGTSYHWGFVVSRTSKHKKEAWDFLAWLNSPVNKLELTKAVEYPPTTKYEIDNFKEDPYMATFASEFQYGRPLPAVKRWKAVEAAIDDNISRYIFSPTRSSAQALSMAEQQVNAILKRNATK